MKLTAGNIVIGDITEASKYFSLVKQLKAEMKRLHGKDRPWMQSWLTVGPGVKVHIRLIMGEPKAYIYISRDVYSWGMDNWAQLGIGDIVPTSWTQYVTPFGWFSLPLPTVILQEKYKAVSAGFNFSLILSNNGDLFGVGNNDVGQLGLGNVLGNDPGLYDATPDPLVIWHPHDDYDFGQLGPPYDHTGPHAHNYRWFPEQIPGKFTDIAAGDYHSIALNNTDLYFWGGIRVNAISVLIISYEPKLIGADFVKISAGMGYSLMLKSNGDVYAMGGNNAGQLGTGGSRTEIVTSPLFVDSDYQAISAGATHSLGLKKDGTVMAWGLDNNDTRFGLGYLPLGGYFLTPIYIDMDDCKFVCASEGYSYAIKNNGDLYVLGLSPSDTAPIGLPYPSIGVNEWTYIGGGYESISSLGGHTLAIKTNGDLVAWGSNENGELGVIGDEFGEHSQDGNQPWYSSIGRIGNSFIPVLVGDGFVSASAGHNHSLAIRNGPPKGDFPIFKSRGEFYLP